MNLVYNDYISDRIKSALIDASMNDKENIIHDIKGPHLDLDPDEGFLVSLKRTIKGVDENGTFYKITIEEDKD